MPRSETISITTNEARNKERFAVAGRHLLVRRSSLDANPRLYVQGKQEAVHLLHEGYEYHACEPWEQLFISNDAHAGG